MNQRIQELANQAGLFADLDGKPWPRALSAEESITAYNKFAQLIICECANTVNGMEQYEGQGDCSTAEYIKEHFGVEACPTNM